MWWAIVATYITLLWVIGGETARGLEDLLQWDLEPCCFRAAAALCLAAEAIEEPSWLS